MQNTLNLNGRFYKPFLGDSQYTPDQREVNESTVRKLTELQTDFKRPGMLLGRIQSGKTKSFIRIMALAFDNGFDVAIILTKGTRALTEQTIQRVQAEYSVFIDSDGMQLFDVMHIPDNLTPYELNQKLVLVGKKENNNMRRLQGALADTYPQLLDRRVLIIDDEADYASIGFKRTKEEGIQMNKIGTEINKLRHLLPNAVFLQVTATPYSIYLQPTNLEVSSERFHPIRPAFTGSIPTFEGYIGGDYYFRESSVQDSVASYLFEPVHEDELPVLRRQDKRVFKLEDALSSKKIHSLRTAILNFIVGSSIRRLQERVADRLPQKYSFIVHTESGKASHEWQHSMVSAIIDNLKVAIAENAPVVTDLVKASYEDLTKSIQVLKRYLPPFDQVLEEVKSCVGQGYAMITKVNSEKDVIELLDSKGQLKLRTPMNIFIGGQILDRGITVANLIGFYYGRRPNRFQQDTVLQHARMYGARPLEDITVTRFYTTQDIYDAMRRIHEIDSSMREAIESGNDEIIFIYTDAKGQITPCSPNKILASTTTSLKPFKRILPIGFQTGFKTYIHKAVEEIDSLLSSTHHDPVLMDLAEAKFIIQKIFSTFEKFGEDYNGVSEEEFNNIMSYLSNQSTDSTHRGMVKCIVRRGRQIARMREGYGPSDLPENRRDELRLAREEATNIPVLLLLRQEGKEEDGWRGTPFWWPVLVAPQETKRAIYARDVVEDTPEEIEE